MMFLYATFKISNSNYNAVKSMKRENKSQQGFTQSTVFRITAAAVFAALVFVVTSQIPPIPIPATSGFFNVGETAIYIAALVFGPLVGALAGGIGSALSDIYLGFPLFAPGTLFIKGAEGLIVGFLSVKLRKYSSNLTVCASIAVIAGGLEMVTGYFLYEQFVLGIPFLVALAEVPFNIAQMIIGLIVAVPVMHAVFRVVPQLKSQF
jgi:uncharacterized membrane protein